VDVGQSRTGISILAFVFRPGLVSFPLVATTMCRLKTHGAIQSTASRSDSTSLDFIHDGKTRFPHLSSRHICKGNLSISPQTFSGCRDFVHQGTEISIVALKSGLFRWHNSQNFQDGMVQANESLFNLIPDPVASVCFRPHFSCPRFVEQDSRPRNQEMATFLPCHFIALSADVVAIIACGSRPNSSFQLQSSSSVHQAKKHLSATLNLRGAGLKTVDSLNGDWGDICGTFFEGR
jgi:hypothetical protein